MTSAVDGQTLAFEKYPIGTILRLMPYHACATGAMHDRIHVVESQADDKVVAVWESCRGWELG